MKSCRIHEVRYIRNIALRPVELPLVGLMPYFYGS
jgi:hypothetical protein